MTSSHHGPYVLGYTRATMAQTERSKPATASKSLKLRPSSDRRLQPASVKMESLVIADQNAAVNQFPGLVHTARHVTKAGCTRSRCRNRKDQGAEGMTGDWNEVVTR